MKWQTHLSYRHVYADLYGEVYAYLFANVYADLSRQGNANLSGQFHTVPTRQIHILSFVDDRTIFVWGASQPRQVHIQLNRQAK